MGRRFVHGAPGERSRRVDDCARGLKAVRAEACITWAILFTSAAQVSAQAATPAPAWTFDASVNTYFLPDEGNYAQPTLAADREWLHLEARFNYEDLNTGSIWFGYNWSGGETVEWALTPTLGGVFGQTDGVAPGYTGSLSWRRIEFSSEGEYVFDADDSANSFFYNWSELTFGPADWLRVGLVTERTRVYETERDIQRGLLVGLTYKNLDVTTYVFNPDDSKPVVMLSVAFSF
jgi:hypothetical protein